MTEYNIGLHIYIYTHIHIDKVTVMFESEQAVPTHITLCNRHPTELRAWFFFGIRLECLTVTAKCEMCEEYSAYVLLKYSETNLWSPHITKECAHLINDILITKLQQLKQSGGENDRKFMKKNRKISKL
jgi:hypothetical protein